MKNLNVSVKQRLLNIAIQQKADFNLLQVRYATERFLYRLSVSPYSDNFLLKGAMLFVLWEDHPHRPTRDMDLLAMFSSEREELENMLRNVLATPVPDDGLVFDTQHIRSEEIREDNAYGGVRVKLLALMDSARITLQIDVASGDAVYPEPQWCDFPTLLEFPSPRIRSYPITSVIAEKLHVIVELQNLNTRMKDYYDIYYLASRFEFTMSGLREAIRQTFQRRRTLVPNATPLGLSSEFGLDPLKQTQWQAFLRRNRLSPGVDLSVVCDQIASFIMPVLQEKNNPDALKWEQGKGWH